jgi:sialic acid synthase SpsE
LIFKRSIYAVEDIQAGDILTPDNIRSIRPGYGLHTRHYQEILGRKATQDLEKGTPLSWKMID